MERKHETAELIRALFTEAADRFDEDPGIIFGTEGQRRGAYETARRRTAKRWQRPGPCVYRGCSRRSIKRSHTIQLGGPIAAIAENSHVVAPKGYEGRVTMDPVGQNEASTFPGFCSEHERLFEEFEQAGGIRNKRDFTLQAYRTLCREIIRKRHEVDHFAALVAQYSSQRSDYFLNAVRRRLPDVQLTSARFEADRMEEMLLDKERDAAATLRDLESVLQDEFISQIEGGTAEPVIFGWNFDVSLPLCLSGMAYFHDGSEEGVLCLLGVMPERAATKIFIASESRHRAYLQDYVDKHFFNAFGLLSALESWMVHGTDHWFMRPSSWDKIPQSRQATILGAILSTRYNIVDPVPFSLLDDPRRQFLELLETKIEEGEADRALGAQLKRRERAKLDDDASYPKPLAPEEEAERS